MYAMHAARGTVDPSGSTADDFPVLLGRRCPIISHRTYILYRLVLRVKTERRRPVSQQQTQQYLSRFSGD